MQYDLLLISYDPISDMHVHMCINISKYGCTYVRIVFLICWADGLTNLLMHTDTSTAAPAAAAAAAGAAAASAAAAAAAVDAAAAAAEAAAAAAE